MWKKLLILSLSIAVLFVFSGLISSANAGGWKNIVNWRVAGPVVNNIQVVTNFNTWPFETTPHYLINIDAHGLPGPAKITLMGVGIPRADYMNNDPCDKSENILQVDFVQNDMVARFLDLSLLFAKNIPGTSYLCADTSTGISTWHAEMEFFRGTGRFEGVTGGEIIGEGTSYSGENSLSGEVGTIKGNITY